MASRQQGPTWTAQPHTLAKIGILKGYLHAWVAIFGQRPVSQGGNLLYVDGFAGPGRYTNSDEGSPVAAMRAAVTTLASLKERGTWRAGTIHCAFIESDGQAFRHLRDHLQPFECTDGLRIHLFNNRFDEGIGQVQQELLPALGDPLPTMVFVDPFGATGVPFAVIRQILSRRFAEALINLDADGIARNWSAGYLHVLDEVFGDQAWRDDLDLTLPFRERCLRILDRYKQKLLGISGVRYAFSFEMLTSQHRVGSVGYFLVFASGHPRGLEKMKEAMREMDQLGNSSFSNARVGQLPMFRADDPERYSELLFERFTGHRAAWNDLVDFALNDTPFTNPRAMLKLLEDRGLLVDVATQGGTRRRGTYPEGRVLHITFKEGP